MIVGLGIDVFDVARMAADLHKADPGFLPRIFTDDEIDHGMRQRVPAEHFAARFAAKEAVAKALAIGDDLTPCWTDIDVGGRRGAEPQVVLRGRVGELAERRGVTRIRLSLARTRRVVVASAILESTP